MISKTHTNVQMIPVTLIALSLLAAPFVSSAQVGNRTGGDGRFCTALDTTETRLMTALDKNLETAVTRYEAHLNTLEQRKDTAVTGLTAKRDQVDANWNARIAEMKAKARTPEQVAAIDAYANTVDALAEQRRASVNAAVATFTDGVADLRSTRDAEYKAIVEAHRADVEAAFANAATACASDGEPATVASTLRTELSTAREEFRAARQAFSVRSEFTVLRQTRVAAATAAREEFRRGLQAANQELRAALSPRN